MQASFKVSPAVLDWLKEQPLISRLPQVQEYLRARSEGQSSPSFEQIEGESEATNIPLGYFFLETPPHEDLALLACRIVDSPELTNPSRELIDTLHDMGQIQDWVRGYVVSGHHESLGYVGAFKTVAGEAVNEEVIQEFAQKVRSILNLTID